MFSLSHTHTLSHTPTHSAYPHKTQLSPFKEMMDNYQIENSKITSRHSLTEGAAVLFM